MKSPPVIFSLASLGFGGNLSQLFFVNIKVGPSTLVNFPSIIFRPDKYNNMRFFRVGNGRNLNLLNSVSADNIQEIIRLLELDAMNVLSFMASNGLAANAKKTTFIILNNKKQNEIAEPISIKVGKESITQETSAKLLGVTMDENQKWHTQIYGKGGLLSSLNSRIITALSNT